MLNENDVKRSNNLVDSLSVFTFKTTNSVRHLPYEKETNTLYRFGWFYINGYKYSVSGWSFKKGIVTFENESTGCKIKYDLQSNDVVGQKFIKDSCCIKYLKMIRLWLSERLRKISDKLHP